MQGMMKTLVVDKDGKLSIEQCEIPQYDECQALVKTISCGICNGTDGKLIHGTFKGFAKDVYPVMLGHEAVGEVIEIGSKVTSFKIGDKVLLPFAGPLSGFTCGWGSYSEYGVVCDPEAYAANGTSKDSKDFPECAFAQTVVDESIDPVKAAMVITLREVLSSIKRFGVKENESVVVYGCGPVGLTFIKFMRLMGVNPIVAVDIVDEKLETAKSKGATYTFNGKDEKLVEKIREIFPDGVDYVIDAAGILAIINQALLLIRDAGKICCYGIASKTNFNIDWENAPYNWQLQFQQFPSKAEEGAVNNQVTAWIKDGIIDLDEYISDIVDFKDILSAFERLEKGEIEKKCIIKY